MEIHELAERAAEMLRSDEALSGAKVIVEEKGELTNELSINIGKRSLAVVVGWNGFISDGISSKTIWGKGKLVVSVYEMPVINRKTPGALTLLKAARAIAYCLNLELADGGLSPLVFKEITPVVQLTGGEKGIVATDVVFSVECTL